MSMSSEPENFEALRRLLALKRHEQPPPGYFHDFSRQVISRIQAAEGDGAETFLGRFLARAPWLRHLWSGLEAKPILAGAFGVGVCGLLVAGLVSSEKIDANPAGLASGESPPTLFVPTQATASLFQPASGDSMPTGSVFTAQSRSSIFDEIRNPHVQPVNFSVPRSAN